MPEAHDQQTVAEVEELTKEYRRHKRATVRALDGVSLTFRKGEFTVLLGPSGCGKTTLLRSIAGLEKPDGGAIRLSSSTVFSHDLKVDWPTEHRGLSMMFQSYALWPNMTVADNVRYPLKSRRSQRGEGGSARRESRDDMDKRVRQTLEMVGIPELDDRYPNQLSGGQQQRVALARALVWREDIVLFDEPLSNVDAKVRDDLRREMSRMQRELGFAAIYVTHDQTEAMQLGDRVVVMRAGRVEQQGTPEDVYLKPQTRFVSNFVGVSNEISGTLAATDAAGQAHGLTMMDTSIGPIWGRSAASCDTDTRDVVASWRPEVVMLTEQEPDGPNRWKARLTEPVFMGQQTECIADLGAHRVKLHLPRENSADLLAGQTWLSVRPEHVSILSQ